MSVADPTTTALAPCPHRAGCCGQSKAGTILGCQLLDTALGWRHGITEAVCRRCQAETTDPQPPSATASPSSLLTSLWRRVLMAPLRSRKHGDAFLAAYGASRAEFARRATAAGFSVQDVRLALMDGVALGCPPPVAREAFQAVVVDPKSLVPTRQVLQHWRKTRQMIGKRTAVASPPPSANGVDINARRSYRRSHPCAHINMKQILSISCATGPVYACGLHGKATFCPTPVTGVTACAGCKDYVELVPARAPAKLDIVVGVTTCPLIRNEQVVGHRDTLPKTLASILAAGWAPEEVTIFAEPESHVPEGWRVVWRDKRLGASYNLIEGIKQLGAEHPGATQLWVEDDTWLATGLREEINRRGGLPPRCGMLQVFRMSGRGVPWRTADQVTEERRSDGYQRLKRKEFLWGANALMFPPTAVQSLINLVNVPRGLSCSPDVKLSDLIPKLGYELWCCNPSLAQTDSTIPSSADHRLTKRMESDTYVPVASEAIPRLLKHHKPNKPATERERGIAVIRAEIAANLAIHVVRPDDKWVLQGIGDLLVEGPNITAGPRPDPKADVNVYINYALFNPKTRSRCDIGYFTHWEPGEKGRQFDAVAGQVDYCIAMSQTTAQRLPPYKTAVLQPPVNPAHRAVRPLVLGVCARNYPRKSFDVARALRSVPNVTVSFTGGKLSHQELLEWYKSIDYLLVTSTVEGGPVPLLEALGHRKPVIAPDTGWCWSYPVIRYRGADELAVIVDQLANPVPDPADTAAMLRTICGKAVEAKANSRKLNLGNRYHQLLDLIDEYKPASIVEVGTWNGDRAVEMIARAMRYRPSVSYRGYDVFELGNAKLDKHEFNGKPRVKHSQVAKRLEALKQAYPLLEYKLVRGLTSATLHPNPVSADLVFIDGGHSVETIRSDLAAVRGSRVIVLDDYYQPDEYGKMPDTERYGCNTLIKTLPSHRTLPVAGRVRGGGIVKMVLIEG